MKKYSNKKLEDLLSQEPIWVKSPKYYRKRLEQSLKANGYTTNQTEGQRSSDIFHETLWWDVSDIVYDLAELLLEERRLRKEAVDEIRDILKEKLK